MTTAKLLTALGLSTRTRPERMIGTRHMFQKSMRRTTMKRNIAATTLMLMAFATFVLSMVPTMQAAQCSQSGIAGQWGFSSTGTILSVVPGPFGAVGRFTLDAAGNITHGNQTANIAGTIDPETLTG